MPFYQRLAALRSARSSDLRIVGAFPKDRESGQDGEMYFAQHHIAPDALEPVNFFDLGISGTPTLVLTSASGIVKSAWTGLLSADKENDVFAKVRALCPKCNAER